MSRPSQIPNTLIIPIIDRLESGEASNSEEISVWLREQHNIEATGRAVTSKIQQYREIARNARKEAIQQAAFRSSFDCLDIIDNSIVLLTREAVKLLESADTKDKLAGKQLSEAALKYIEKKMSLSGVDGPNKESEESTVELMQDLLKKLSV